MSTNSSINKKLKMSDLLNSDYPIKNLLKHFSKEEINDCIYRLLIENSNPLSCPIKICEFNQKEIIGLTNLLRIGMESSQKRLNKLERDAQRSYQWRER